MTTSNGQDGWRLLDPGGRAVKGFNWVGRGGLDFTFSMTDDLDEALTFDANEQNLAEATAEACRSSEPGCGVTAVPLHLTQRDQDAMWDAGQYPA